MEDTGHYHFALLKNLLDNHYSVALINPVTTDLTRKLQGGISKNDNLDSLTICDVISSAFSFKDQPNHLTTDRSVVKWYHTFFRNATRKEIFNKKTETIIDFRVLHFKCFCSLNYQSIILRNAFHATSTFFLYSSSS